jgi:hypothetical protein
MLRIPGGGCGRSDAIAQPQDIFATVARLGGCELPAGTDGRDLIEVARGGAPTSRRVALAGSAVGGWRRAGASSPLFSALDGDWCLAVAASPEACRLRRAGCIADVAGEHSDVVQALRSAAIAEIERRGLDPALVRWLREEGRGEFPEGARITDAHPAPAGWHQYWNNIYRGE